MTDRLILTHLLNGTEIRQTHYINNKTIGPRPAGSWTVSVDFVQFVNFDVAFEWILWTLWISIFRQTGQSV